MKRNYSIVALILIIFFVISFLSNILGALNPSISKSFNLSETMAGFLPFSFFIAYGVMSIPAGFLVEKFGEKKTILFAFLLALLGSLLFSHFPTLPVFIFTLFTIGTGMAVLQVAINPLLRVAGGEENYAFTSVVAQLIFGAASFVSPHVYSWLVTNIDKKSDIKNWFVTLLSEVVPANMSWVSMYWVFAIVSVLMVFLVLVISIPKIELNEDEKVGSKQNFIVLIKNKVVILYFFGIFAYVGAEQGISYWMSKFLQVHHGYDFETIGANAVGNFWGAMTLGGVLGLVLLKILDSKLVLRVFTILSIICLGIALFGDSVSSLYAFQASGFFLSVMYPIIISLALNSVSKHHGSFAGILMTGIMGGAVVQLLIGMLSDFTSLKTGMLLVFVALAYILSLSFWAKPIIKNKIINLSKK
ncbi:MAG: MFS transporter [Flavobacteriales bacterium]|tara:strand:+ start:22114 stop:23361 length:1248 start_codon:yes stop_codon:yes gene_type:complete